MEVKSEDASPVSMGQCPGVGGVPVPLGLGWAFLGWGAFFEQRPSCRPCGGASLCVSVPFVHPSPTPVAVLIRPFLSFEFRTPQAC